MKLWYGELALKEETDGMAEINLWDLIVVKLSELGILKRYIIYKTSGASTTHRRESITESGGKPA